MAANSMGAFAAFKVRDQIKNSQSDEKPGSSQSSAKMSVTQTDCPDNPTKYSSKAMMAIWGMYNRYSVHNFKSNGNSYDHKA